VPLSSSSPTPSLARESPSSRRWPCRPSPFLSPTAWSAGWAPPSSRPASRERTSPKLTSLSFPNAWVLSAPPSTS
ncbi:hypothetical protein BN1723_020936, partial [Verticillium longisporum]